MITLRFVQIITLAALTASGQQFRLNRPRHKLSPQYPPLVRSPAGRHTNSFRPRPMSGMT